MRRGAWPLTPSVYAIDVAVPGSEVFIGLPPWITEFPGMLDVVLLFLDLLTGN